MFDQRLFGVPWSVLAAVAAAIAVVYLVWDLAGAETGWRWVVLRWGHGLCWLLLMGAALAKARITPLPEAWAGSLAVAGGLTYALFILTSVLAR